jgi:hypothetical protein
MFAPVPVERRGSTILYWLTGSCVICIDGWELPEVNLCPGARLRLAVSRVQKMENYSAVHDRFVGTVNQDNGHLLKPVGTCLKRGNRLYDVRRLDKHSTLHRMAGNRNIGYHHRIIDSIRIPTIDDVTAALVGPECLSCERQNDTTQ